MLSLRSLAERENFIKLRRQHFRRSAPSLSTVCHLGDLDWFESFGWLENRRVRMSRENEKHLFQHVSTWKGAALSTGPVIKKLNMHSIGNQVGFHFQEKRETLSRAWPRRFAKATNQAKKADKLKHNAETEQADPRDVRWKRLRSGGRDWRRRTSCPHVKADSRSAPESRFLCSPVIPHPSDSPRKPHKSVLSLPSTGDKSTWRLAWCIVQNVNNNKCC